MPFIDWVEEYSVNHADMDQHHRKIIDLINSIHAAILNNNVRIEIQSVLNELYDYTKYHFEAEEKLLAKHNFSDLEDHLKSHNYLRGRVKELRDKFFTDPNSNIFELMGFLRTWFIEHILQEDKPALQKLDLGNIEKGVRNEKTQLGETVQP